MPGQSKCFKCGSALEIGSLDESLEPTRVAGWKKPIRWFFRKVRASSLVPFVNAEIRKPEWVKTIFSEGILAAFLSIIPGLAHFIQGRFKKIWWCVLVWAIALFCGLFFYGSSWGMCFLGVTVGLHAWIAIDAGLIEEVKDFGHRVLLLIFVAIALFVIYRFTGSIIFQNITGGYSSLTIPAQEIRAGDFLLTSRSRLRNRPITRGSLILTHLSRFRQGGRDLFAGRRDDLMVIQIVGLPGEQLEIKEGLYFINGSQLDPERYPLPGWLRNVKASVTIPSNEYFISAEYDVRRYGMNIRTEDIVNVCVVPGTVFEARAFMRWSPLTRRGFIREYE
jgi:hypothetical protein